MSNQEEDGDFSVTVTVEEPIPPLPKSWLAAVAAGFMSQTTYLIVAAKAVFPEYRANDVMVKNTIWSRSDIDVAMDQLHRLGLLVEVDGVESIDPTADPVIPGR